MYFPIFYSFLLCTFIFLVLKIEGGRHGLGFKEFFLSRIILKTKIKTNVSFVIRKKTKIRNFINWLMGDICVFPVGETTEVLTDNTSLKILKFNSNIQEKIKNILISKGVKNIVINNGEIKVEVPLFYAEKRVDGDSSHQDVVLEEELQHVASYIELFLSKIPRTDSRMREAEHKMFLNYMSFRNILYSLFITNIFYFIYTQVMVINGVFLVTPLELYSLNMLAFIVIFTVICGLFIKLQFSDSIWSVVLIRKFWLIFMVCVLSAINSIYITNIVFDINKKTYSLHNYEILESTDVMGRTLYILKIDNTESENQTLDKGVHRVRITQRDALLLKKTDYRDHIFISVGRGFLGKAYMDNLVRLNHLQFSKR